MEQHRVGDAVLETRHGIDMRALAQKSTKHLRIDDILKWEPIVRSTFGSGLSTKPPASTNDVK
jgi:hypothetical protein